MRRRKSARSPWAPCHSYAVVFFLGSCVEIIEFEEIVQNVCSVYKIGVSRRLPKRLCVYILHEVFRLFNHGQLEEFFFVDHCGDMSVADLLCVTNVMHVLGTCKLKALQRGLHISSVGYAVTVQKIMPVQSNSLLALSTSEQSNCLTNEEHIFFFQNSWSGSATILTSQQEFGGVECPVLHGSSDQINAVGHCRFIPWCLFHKTSSSLVLNVTL